MNTLRHAYIGSDSFCYIRGEVMKKVFLPDTTQQPEAQTFLEPEELRRFRLQSKALVERADSMAASIRQVPKHEVTALARDTYAFIVQLFELKKARGAALLPEEQAVFQLCKAELLKYPVHATESSFSGAAVQVALPARSMRTAQSNAAVLIRGCLAEINCWFSLSTETEQADRCIIDAGKALLPHYAALTKGFFTVISELFVPFLTASALDMLEAQAECALLYQDNDKPVNKQLASAMLTVAGYARHGHTESTEEGFEKLSKAEIPEELRVLYEEATGLLTGADGLQAWLGKKDGCIAVAFAGTDFRNPDMVMADILQLSEPSILYLKAAGLLHLLLKHMPDATFCVCGHSLGGGLAQFSLAANMEHFPDRLTGYAYNPAGLSMVSLRHLEASRLKAAAQNMWVFMTCRDIVSAIGGKIGCLTTLPETTSNGHGMDDLKACMKAYLETP